ncbi:alpha/beta fold hydrolase [Amycolatopsis silviterrae]|uniref:Alpha/beta fold hydrolase n=1 Tax=Amycolatopsis silviterrae TaxID=1656914 RepID=A0ABW5HC27_9PSEU
MTAIPDGFRSEFVTTARTRHHVVTGGDGPPLLLINGWPQTWYAWRHVLRPLAGHFTVVAAEPRGMGKSAKPRDGYDAGSLSDDLVAVMAELGHEKFAVLGHDIGMWIGYAMAVDHPARVTRLAVAEAAIPGISPEAPFFSSATTNNRLFHFSFNRLEGINEDLVRGRESLYFGHQFATKSAPDNELEPAAVAHYVASIAESPDALRASFEPYRAIEVTIEQNRVRRETRLTLPILAIGGETSAGAAAGETMASVADNVVSHVIEGSGHYPAEERPEAFLALVLPFLAAGE